MTTMTKAARAERDREFEALYQRADAAGQAAAEAVVPTPMYLVERENPFDDTSRVVTAYAPVMDGPCGFAWVTVVPGGSAFARWAKVNRGWRIDSYAGGMRKNVSAYNQSMTRKESYATAFAGVLREAGIKAYGESRMD